MPDFIPSPDVTAPQPTAPVAVSGLSDSAAGALAYVTIIPAIIFLLIDPYRTNPFIRFHAFQCLGLAVVGFAASVVMVVPLIGWLIGIVAMPVLVIAWLFCIVKASQGVKFKLPILGPMVENLAR
jgi:uncharacterized membrane protein